jgi:excisionase family DNA binding protein
MDEEAIERIICGVVAQLRPVARQPYLTPPQVAEQLGIEPAKVIGWIRRGELKAANVADRLGGRPRYRISTDSLDAFLNRRQPVQAPPRTHRKRRQPADLIEFV